jgi:hypothetical protein
MPENLNENKFRSGQVAPQARIGAVADSGRSSAMGGGTSDGGNFRLPYAGSGLVAITPQRRPITIAASSGSCAWKNLRLGLFLCGEKMAGSGRPAFDQSRSRH